MLSHFFDTLHTLDVIVKCVTVIGLVSLPLLTALLAVRVEYWLRKRAAK